MDQIIIVSKNKGIVSKDELLPFAESLKNSLNAKVEFYTPKHLGTQVTFNEVIDVWLILAGKKVLDKILDKALDKTLDQIFDAFIQWGKKRLYSELNKRPKSLTVRDEKGKKIKSITLNEKGEVVDDTNKIDPFIPTAPKNAEPFFDEGIDKKKDI